MPFCSVRCQQIDLGRWLGEQYSVPHVPTQEELDAMEGMEDFDPESFG